MLAALKKKSGDCQRMYPLSKGVGFVSTLGEEDTYEPGGLRVLHLISCVVMKFSALICAFGASIYHVIVIHFVKIKVLWWRGGCGGSPV